MIKVKYLVVRQKLKIARKRQHSKSQQYSCYVCRRTEGLEVNIHTNLRDTKRIQHT